jgi:hypothetical protein
MLVLHAVNQIVINKVDIALRKCLVWIENSIRIHQGFNVFHDLNCLLWLWQMNKWSLLKTKTMFGTDASTTLSWRVIQLWNTIINKVKSLFVYLSTLDPKRGLYYVYTNSLEEEDQEGEPTEISWIKNEKHFGLLSK